jgi:orotidine-5'-phosphate decarboxylase
VTADERLLVALDLDALGEADHLLDRLAGQVGACKIGAQLFTAAGPAAVEHARKRGFRVFLDLKFHDIPHAVAGAVREATRLGAFMLTVHASGGAAMMRAAAAAAAAAAQEFGLTRPLCVGVTVLTSLGRADLRRDLGLASAVEAHVLDLAENARAAGLDGCVASPQELRPLRNLLGPSWVIVTPGVRPAGDPTDDQARTATPAAAIAAGADYLVVGRPITGAADPAAAARAILAEVRSVTPHA